jgi:hypothetical protein
MMPQQQAVQLQPASPGPAAMANSESSNQSLKEKKRRASRSSDAENGHKKKKKKKKKKKNYHHRSLPSKPPVIQVQSDRPAKSGGSNTVSPPYSGRKVKFERVD